MASTFEEKYLHLRDENLELKKKKNEQEATIKRMYTKLAMIEETMKKKKLSEDADNQDDTDKSIPVKRDFETEKFVQALKTENAQLRKKNQTLMEKNRQLEEKMRQHQLKYHNNTKAASASATNASLGARTASVSMGKRMPPTAAAKVHNATRKRSLDGASISHQVDQARRVHRDHLTGDLEMALKNRLVVAEKQLVKLQHENERLRLQHKRGSSLVGRRASANHHHNNNSDGEPSDREDAATRSLDVDHWKRELRDRQAQLAILNARYENLEANTAAEREIQEKTIEQLEHMNRQVHKLRSQLQDTSLDKEEMEVKLAKTADLQQEVVMLRDQNRKLEERMTVMCESPFINDAFQRKERIDKLFDLETLTQQQKATITTMADESQRLQATIKELQVNIKLMKQAKDQVEQDLDRLHQQLLAERNSRSLPMAIATPAARPPSPHQPRPVQVFTNVSIQPDRRDAASSPLKNEQASSVSFASVQHTTGATPIVTRRYLDVLALGGPLAVHAATGDEESSVKHLKNRVHVLQMAHLKAVQELERCEKMLHAQTNINRELAQEIDELTTKNVSGSAALQKRVKELELMLDERQHRLQMLEAQNRQLKFARERLLRAQENDKQLADLVHSSDDEEDEETGSDVASVSESLVMAARDLAPGEQLLEIWILGATFDRSVVSSNASTFMLCDFYDFESQSTPLLIGHRPEYNFASTFKVTVDAFFLRYLASETLVFELYQAVQGDFRLIGRASVALATLLRARGVLKEPALPVKLAYGADHDTVIGTVNVVLRFAAPISEIWKIHLQSYPQDIQLLRTHRLASAEDASLDDAFDDDNQPKAVNELQITVLGCRGLRSYLKKKPQAGHALSTTPSPYVHYQILGFPDVFTNIVPSTTSPEFDLHTSKQFFSVEVDACLLHFFSKFQLWFTVFDDHAELERDGASDGAIGRCGLLLDEVAKGECVRGWFALKDRNDQPAGEISVLIEWKDPFQVAQLYSSRRAGGAKRQADLHSLDYDQQHAVMRLFAPDMDGRVNYRQFLTYAFPPEALELVTSKIKERLEYAIETEQLASVEDLFAGDKASKASPQEISVAEFLKRIERFGVFLKEGEVDLLVQIFSKRQAGKADNALEPTRLLVPYLNLHINPRVTCAERLLLHKIRHTLRLFVRPEPGAKPASTKPSPSQPFERFDPILSGFVSRAEFKRSLGVLGFELLDITKAYKEFVQSGVEAAASTNQSEKPDQPSSIQADAVDLDEPALTSHKTASTAKREHTVPNAKQQLATAASQPVHRVVKPTTVDPRTEFDRRKELFMERMKAIASTSAKSLVYEQIAKQKQDRHAHADRSAAKEGEALAQRVQQQLTQLQVPKALHHDAAKILQNQYRQYRLRRAMAAPPPAANVHIPQGGIVETDALLQRILSTWTRDELESLETAIIDTIESELPDAKKTKLISKKQLGFVLSKIPRIALEPELLCQLSDFFTVPTKDQQSLVAYRPLVHFVCSVATEPKKNERQSLPVLKLLTRVHLDAMQALHVFTAVGDMNGSGKISIKRFREVLRRLGLQLPAKDLRVLLVLLSDARAIDILYLPLVKLLRDSPTATHTHAVVGRCSRFGITKLREALIMHVRSDDGCVSREDLHRVLMQFNTETSRFEPTDAQTLVEITKSNRASGASPSETPTISIEELVLMLERMSQSLESPLGDDTLNRYSADQLQRLAQSSRTLLTGSYSDILAEFERFDWRESGLVSLAEFISVVTRAGFSLFTPGQDNLIAKLFGAKLKGAFGINYRQFLDWTTPPPAPLEVDAIEAKLRRFATQSVSEGKPITQVLTGWREAFAAVDRLSEGALPRGQFASVCLDTLRLPLSDDELRVVLMSYDRSMDDCVNFNAFVQLDWAKTSQVMNQSQQQRRQVQFDSSTRPVGEVMASLRRALLANKVTSDSVLRSVATIDATRGHPLVNVTQFLVSIKKLGAVVSTGEAELIFQAHADRSERLDLLVFVEQTLGIKSQCEPPSARLSTEEEDRLRTAVTSALKYSRKEFTQALEHLEEFCVVYNHGDVPARKVWKTMEKNGLLGLLSKKGAGLLIQKFTVNCHDADEAKDRENEDPPTVVSLQRISKFLHRLAAETSPRSSAQSAESTVSSDGALAAVKRLLVLTEHEGMDLRGAFEHVDSRYSGLISALDFKRVLLDAGFGRVIDSGYPDVLIGLLVRDFRSRDGISYAWMLTRLEATPDREPLLTFCESLRARIRLRARLQGSIQLENNVATLCRSLDAAFSHFDRDNKGFLTQSDVIVGLQALKYNVSNEHVEYFMQIAGVFRHNNNTRNAGLSRMEFDTFALDPVACRLLQRLASELYQPSHEGPALPRIAQLSRLFINHDQPRLVGVLPSGFACDAINQVTRNGLHARDKARLQILFDVNRDGHFAYRLFMKVISQWQSLADGSSAAPDPSHRPTSSTPNEFRCSSDDVVRALYNQISSVDFDTQIDILEEYLRRAGSDRADGVAREDFERTLDRISLKLTTEAVTSLQQTYSIRNTSRIDFRSLIKAIKGLHDEDDD